MPGKKITDHQVKKYNQHRNKHSQVAAAAKAGISERSASRCLTPPKKYLNKSTTCGASVFIAVDLFIISSQTISFLVLPGIASMPRVW